MNDDWRLRIELADAADATALGERLDASELEHDLETAFHDRVIVSVDGREVFCYAAAREQAERAEQLVRSLAEQHHWTMNTELRHWHPSAEEWEDPDKPLPASDAERVAERAELMARERSEAAAQGYPEFEVRVNCHSHRDTLRLAERLRAEGLQTVHRWRYLIVSASDEDSANVLAERLRAEVPASCEVTAEGSGRAAYEERPANPFAVFGGLGG